MNKILSVFIIFLLVLVPFTLPTSAAGEIGVTTLNYNQHRDVVTSYSNETDEGFFVFASYQDNSLVSCKFVPAIFNNQECTVEFPNIEFGSQTKVFLWKGDPYYSPLCAGLELKGTKEAHSVVSNIYPWGVFDREEQTKLIGANYSEVSFDTTNQKTGEGCLKLDMHAPSNDVFFSAPLVAGETYDISFDYKKDIENTNDVAKIFLRHHNQEAGVYTFIDESTDIPTTEWKTYTTTWTYTGDNNLTDYDNGCFYLRYGTKTNDQTQEGTIYIDNFSVKPHGDVFYDYTLLEDKLVWETNAQLIEPAKENAPIMYSVYVDSETGSDENDGSAQAPFKTIYAARDYVRTINGNMTGDIKVYIRGEHYLPETFQLTNEDSGTNGYKIEYTSWDKNDKATLSMGKDYTGFALYDETKNIYRVKVSDIEIDEATAPKINIDAANTSDGKVYAIPGNEYAGGLTDKGNNKSWIQTNVQLTYNLPENMEAGNYALSFDYLSAYPSSSTSMNHPYLQIFVDGTAITDIFELERTAKDWNNGITYAKTYDSYTDDEVLIPITADSEKVTIQVHNTSSLTTAGVASPVPSGFAVKTENSFTLTMKEGIGETTRQAYFNGNRGIRSRTVSGFDVSKVTTDTQNGVAGNPWLFDGNSYYHEIENEALLTNCQYPTEVEMRYVQKWTDFRAQITDISTADGKTKVSLHKNLNSYIKYNIDNQWPNATNDRYPIYFENAYEFLDAKGEWYLNPHDGYLYYIPRDGEDMDSMVLTIPKGEKMITINGASSARPVSHITFSDLNLTETAWNWPTYNGGHFGSQNYVSDWNLTGERKEIMPEGAIEVNNAWYVNFENNDISKIGAIRAINMPSSIHHCDIIGNEFYDLAGGAVSIGTVGGSNSAKITVKTEEWEENNTVNNNYIHDVALDYMASAAITLGIVRKTTVNHNEIVNIPYSAVHVGWGWGGTIAKGTDMYDIEVGYNRIEEYLNDRLYDGGGTYAVGCQSHEFAAENHSRMIGNYYIGLRNAYSPIYLDRGTRYWDCTDNVIDQSDVVVQEKNFDDVYYYNEQIKTENRVEQYGFLWGLSSNNVDTVNNIFKRNYSKNANVVSAFTRLNEDGDTNMIDNAIFFGYDGDYTEWSDEAKNIMTNAGIEEEYRDNFDFGGAKYFVVRQKEYKMTTGANAKIDMKVKGRNETEFPVSDYDMNFYTDSDIISITSDGIITANQAGEAWVMVTAEVNGKTQVKQLHVIVS